MKKNYCEPDRNNQHNYMLDTSAYNHIVKSPERIDTVKQSISLGFCYYSTALQDNELSGKGAKTYNKDCISVVKRPMPLEMKQKFDLLDIELNVKLVPEIASFMRDHARVDGTNRFLAPDSLEGQLYKKIEGKNKSESNRPFEYSYDAMIAEAAVHYGCVLVSDDGTLKDLVNSFLPNSAITTDELIETINTFKS